MTSADVHKIFGRVVNKQDRRVCALWWTNDAMATVSKTKSNKHFWTEISCSLSADMCADPCSGSWSGFNVWLHMKYTHTVQYLNTVHAYTQTFMHAVYARMHPAYTDRDKAQRQEGKGEHGLGLSQRTFQGQTCWCKLQQARQDTERSGRCQKIKRNDFTNERVLEKSEDGWSFILWKRGCRMLRVVRRPVLQQQREGNKRDGWREGNREEGGRMRG